MNVALRDAKRADAAAIARIHAASWKTTYSGVLPSAYLRSLDPARLEKRWDRILRHRTSDIVVAEAAGVVLGFATAGPARHDDDAGFAGELFMLYVDPDAHRAGVGRALVAETERRLGNRGNRWMVVWVVAENKQALDFYQALEFRPDGARRLDSVGGGSTPVVRLAKPVGVVVQFALV